MTSDSHVREATLPSGNVMCCCTYKVGRKAGQRRTFVHRRSWREHLEAMASARTGNWKFTCGCGHRGNHGHNFFKHYRQRGHRVWAAQLPKRPTLLPRP